MFGQLAVFDLRQVRGGCVPDATPGGRSVRSGRWIRCPLLGRCLRARDLRSRPGAAKVVHPVSRRLRVATWIRRDRPPVQSPGTGTELTPAWAPQQRPPARPLLRSLWRFPSHGATARQALCREATQFGARKHARAPSTATVSNTWSDPRPAADSEQLSDATVRGTNWSSIRMD